MHQANSAFITSANKNTAVAVASASAFSDHVVALLTERAAQMAAFVAGPDEDDSPHFARCTEIDEELIDIHAETPAGAIASLEYLRSELLEFVLSGRGESEARLYLSLIDGALGVLRKLSRQIEYKAGG